MADHSAHSCASASSSPARRLVAAGFVRRTASTERLAELHRLCDEDYASNAARRAQNHRDDAFLIAPAAEGGAR
ncbi:hypothetical protein BX257_4765 [Streptomyces sp. 3212.3]|uniref:hypothetical protein n=1 Tax=Streptomyces sp. 3212.3 TaxID=1938846 RepID=UPI000E3A25AB|nr:hypothetical protein [Streptomyces sp. 3212.3]REE62152.1 hypothetical protein BX257_4765 [Streptomyces sp. 3212.3]